MTWTDELVVRVYTYTQSRTVNPLVVTIRPSISLPRHQLLAPGLLSPPATFLPSMASRHRIGGTKIKFHPPAISQKFEAKKSLAEAKAEKALLAAFLQS